MKLPFGLKGFQDGPLFCVSSHVMGRGRTSRRKDTCKVSHLLIQIGNSQ